MNFDQSGELRDIPVEQLVPSSPQPVDPKRRARLAVQLQAVGLEEPIAVLDRGGTYDILDGHVRCEILLESGVTSIPCLVFKETQTS
jgi:ParB-like chromosome segregation protein Spo0J